MKRKRIKRKKIKTIPALMMFIKKCIGEMVTLRCLDHEKDGENQTQIFRGKITEYTPYNKMLTFKTHGVEMKIPLFSKREFIAAILPDKGDEYYCPSLNIPKKSTAKEWKTIMNFWLERAGEGNHHFLIQ